MQSQCVAAVFCFALAFWLSIFCGFLGFFALLSFACITGLVFSCCPMFSLFFGDFGAKRKAKSSRSKKGTVGRQGPSGTVGVRTSADELRGDPREPAGTLARLITAQRIGVWGRSKFDKYQKNMLYNFVQRLDSRIPVLRKFRSFRNFCRP